RALNLSLLRSARSAYDSLRLQLGSKRALDVFTSNSARPILSKRFSAWFTSDSVPWAAPLNIRTQPTELTRITHKKASKAAPFFCKFLVLNKLNFTKRTPLR